MSYKLLILLFITCIYNILQAKPEKIEKYIMIDQFGYRPGDPKVAVIVNPQIGFNAEDSFEPDSILQVREWNSDNIIFSGNANVWKNGTIDFTSGDKGWWFDFSSVTKEGDYYIYSLGKNVGSGKFSIQNDIYKNMLRAACRTFYYQRINSAKELPFAEKPWTEEAAFIGPGQDTEARYLYDKENPATARDLSGGWMDAGDSNKYITFAESVVHNLLTAYHQNPAAFTDDYNIPESGNGIPDIIDEVKYEMDWIKKMQDDDGGFFIKMGNVDWNASSPPSTDKRPRYYGPKCSSSSIAGAAVLAHAALIYSDFTTLKVEVPDLKERALKAWDWFQSHPKCDTCDSGEIKAGDADISVERQIENEVVAAIYLLALTQDQKFDHVIKEKFSLLTPYYNTPLALYKSHQGDALLFYTTLSQADSKTKEIILAHRLQEGVHKFEYQFIPEADLYRAYIPYILYTWGAHNPRAALGSAIYDLILYNLDANNHQKYLTRALGILHYFHGVNPLGVVYMTSMERYGAEKCIVHLWHDWFNHTTTISPPGYLPGGPNAAYSGSLQMLKEQPVQKAYLDWNTGYPENCWEITEPAIYYQASYIKLVSKFIGR